MNNPQSESSRLTAPHGGALVRSNSCAEGRRSGNKARLRQISKSLPLVAEKRVEKHSSTLWLESESSLDSETLDCILQEFLCPITSELPIDPVAAEDGQTYERYAIEKWIDRHLRDLRSPVTNQPMGTKVFPATKVRNAIERAVRSGAIAGEKAERWNKRIEAADEVEEIKQKSDEGDAEAMYLLGFWHQSGKNGMKKDVSKAYSWYKKAADYGSICGMAAAGFFLVKGFGVDENRVEGMALITFAACEQGGVDAAANCLGTWYSEGLYGLPKSQKWAIFWLKKVVSGSCSVRHMDERGLNKARKRLDELLGADRLPYDGEEE